MNILGKIKEIQETETFGSNGFRKRNLIIVTNEQYPQTILIEFVQDKTEYLDKFNAGENVDVSINLRGREWVNPQGETKYFNSVQGWRIVSAENNDQPAPQPLQQAPINNNENEGDGLPF